MALFDTTFAPGHAFGSRPLAPGDAGTDVAVLQALCNLMLGSIPSPSVSASLPVSGLFDASTGRAVATVQSYFGTAQTGTVGTETFLLFGQGTGPHPPYGGPIYGSRRLKLGDSGADVTISQNRLNCFHYAGALGHRANGSYDTATAACVIAFKKRAEELGDSGFPRNTIVGEPAYNASWLYMAAGGRSIGPGCDGLDTLFVQLALQSLGYYPGPPNGYYDAAARQAIQAFQSACRIAADGIAGPETFYQMGLRQTPPPSPFSHLLGPRPCSTVPHSCAHPAATAILSPGAAWPEAYGAAVVLKTSGAFTSVDVVGNSLPMPSDLDSAGYVVTVASPDSKPLVSSRLSPIPAGPGAWAGHVSGLGLPPMEKAAVSVLPPRPGECLRAALLEGVLGAPEAPGCLGGVDNDVDLSSAAPCLKEQGYSFVGRYLGGPCYQFTPLSLNEAQAISQSGLLLVSIYVGANAVTSFSCGVQTLAQGQQDGQDAADLARNVCQPTGSAIYLNLQPSQIHGADTWLSYVQGWTASIELHGYIPGVYSSADQLHLIRQQLWCSSHLLYWVTSGPSATASFPRPAPGDFCPLPTSGSMFSRYPYAAQPEWTLTAPKTPRECGRSFKGTRDGDTNRGGAAPRRSSSCGSFLQRVSSPLRYGHCPSTGQTYFSPLGD